MEYSNEKRINHHHTYRRHHRSITLVLCCCRCVCEYFIQICEYDAYRNREMSVVFCESENKRNGANVFVCMSPSFSKLGSIHFHYKQPNTIRTQTDAHCNGSLHIPLVILCNIHSICGQHTRTATTWETDSSTLAQHTTLCTVHTVPSIPNE